MTRYLLDTDALIDFSKGLQPVTATILSWIDGNDIVAVCPITVAEFYTGLSPEEAARWEPFMNSLPYLAISREAAGRAGQDRYALARSGRRITTSDALLAAVAREQGATLVTSNLKDFPMDDLSLLSIR